MSEVDARIADNLASVRSRIEAAALRAGRRADAVTLVAVTKYVGQREIRALLAAGCRDLGESRPQQLWQKAAALSAASDIAAGHEVRWHLVGHLQRNKVDRTALLVALVHSGDSPRILQAIDAAVRDSARPRLPILLEVNISGDPRKHGFAPTELEPQLGELAALAGIEIRGLMAMAGKPDELDAARADFAQLRGLRDRLQTACPAGVRLDELSMGMSGDFEAAIEEGATIVRIGSALFEGVV